MYTTYNCILLYTSTQKHETVVLLKLLQLMTVFRALHILHIFTYKNLKPKKTIVFVFFSKSMM